MLGFYPALFLQSIGVIIPIVGIGLLLFKNQGKANVFLLLANFGALVMNWTYLQLMRSVDLREAMSLYKFEYIGSVIFYFFFGLFLNSLFSWGKKTKAFVALFIGFFIIEQITLCMVLTNNPLGYEAVTVNYREDDGSFFEKDYPVVKYDIQMEDVYEDYVNFADDKFPSKLSDKLGYVTVHGSYGIILRIRLFLLGVILFGSLVNSVIATLRRKNRNEQKRLLYIVGAECVILISLLITSLLRNVFNPTSILVSASLLFIILGTASGNLYTIADLGRGWAIDKSENIFVIIDVKGRFLDANEFAQRIFPVLKDLTMYDDLPEEFRNLIMSDQYEFEWENRFYSKKSAPIELKKEVAGYSITFVDVTEQHNLMIALEEERQKAIDANEAKSNFMSNMSHEIRTPMNAIVGMTEIMLKHEQNEFNTEYLTNIQNSGTALISVINDILDFSKIESGKIEIIPDEYEIMSVLNDLSMIFLNRIGEKQLELIYDIDPKMPTRLYGDSVRIRQVLLNIVNNGIKYSEEGFVKLTIDVSWLSDDEIMLNCSVQDTGIGIKEEDLPKLFSTFSQVDTKKNRGKEGTGLGLSIAKQLVEVMGGKMTVSSVYGEGSTFSFGMVQKVVDATPAARIKVDEDVYVSCYFSSDRYIEMTRKLCQVYEHINYVEIEDIISRKAEKLDYLFLDRISVCRRAFNDIDEETIKEIYKPELILMHNPMRDNCDELEATVVNSPIYTLSFCQAINHEVQLYKQKHEKVLSFKAPDAKILIVDDNEMNRKVAAGLLEPIGMQIDNAVDGKQAVEKVLAEQYDIVLMDHMMPIMDGVEATKVLREHDIDVPIIALSANALIEAREQFKAAGMDDFIAKPIKTKELFNVIRKYLPAEKVIDGDEIVEDASASDIDNLPVIEGLEVAAGIENSGGLKLFTSLLGDFYKLIDKKAVKIEKCLEDGLVRDFTIEVHALKNTARMIGALELSDMFYKLEQAGNSEDYDTIDRLTGATLEKYRSYKPILQPYANEVDNSQKEVIDSDTILQTIEKLKNCVDNFDLDGADEAVKLLESYQVPEEIRSDIEELGTLVADVAMEDVINLCDRIINGGVL